MNDPKPNSADPVDTGTAPLTAAEEHYNRIAEAAYLRAAARGFVGGDPLEDWLAAEADLMKSAHSAAPVTDGDENSTTQESRR